jgi:hypothetical protein
MRLPVFFRLYLRVGDVVHDRGTSIRFSTEATSNLGGGPKFLPPIVVPHLWSMILLDKTPTDPASRHTFKHLRRTAGVSLSIIVLRYARSRRNFKTGSYHRIQMFS